MLAPSAASFASPLRAVTMMTSVRPTGVAAMPGTLLFELLRDLDAELTAVEHQDLGVDRRSPTSALSSLASAWSSTWADVS